MKENSIIAEMTSVFTSVISHCWKGGNRYTKEGERKEGKRTADIKQANEQTSKRKKKRKKRKKEREKKKERLEEEGRKGEKKDQRIERKT